MILWLFTVVMLFTIIAVAYIYLTNDKYLKLDDYLTARNRFSTFPATMTIFASIMGSWILFTPAEAGTWGGIAAFGGYALAQALAVMVFAYFGPRMRNLAPKGTTLFEFVFYRYGKGMYMLVLLIGVFYMAVFLAAELTGIATAVNLVAGIPLWVTALIIGCGTLIYTAYGGIRGSIFTDVIQALVILPTVLIAFFATVRYTGGFGDIVVRIKNINPDLLSLQNIGGLNFAASLAIAVVAANMFNQGFWSRVYACKDNTVVRRSFLIAGVLIIPIMMITGSFGLLAVAEGTLHFPSAALFEVVMYKAAPWVIYVVVLLAIVLVMSSVDTLINALAAIFTVDIARFKPRLKPSVLQTYARMITAAICGIVIFVASKGYSVLYLFLIADLVCTAAVFPTFYGMFSKRFNGTAGVISILTGIAAGIPFFPDPSMQGGNLLNSFLMAAAVSIILALALERFSKYELNFESLKENVQDIQG